MSTRDGMESDAVEKIKKDRCKGAGDDFGALGTCMCTYILLHHQADQARKGWDSAPFPPGSITARNRSRYVYVVDASPT